MRALKMSLIFLGFLIVALSGCDKLNVTKPIIPIEDYEKMIMGRIDANYIGNENCLSACHAHDEIERNFLASTMGTQVSKSGMPIVNCESCHGPGSLAVEGITPEKVEQDAREGKQTACNYDTFVDIKELPAPAQSLICLKCHSGYSAFSLHNWSAGARSDNDVSCSSCHNIHAGADLITSPRDTNDMCLKCHPDVRAEFLLPSRHPVPENKIFCTDCHNAHGTVDAGLLKEDTVKETCTTCHGEKEGPYTFEHADINEECLACHGPHGAVNDNLLTVREPFLCLQCHGGHSTDELASAESKGAFYTRCSDCHSQLHGTDVPSATGRGFFIN
jgi:DmsE family decaheme c-type cytochrome